jgi:hypothetical protein
VKFVDTKKVSGFLNFYNFSCFQTTFNDAIVFVVGGGNYIEYQNLTDYVKGKNAALGGETQQK